VDFAHAMDMKTEVELYMQQMEQSSAES
jgi:hypothetical protein